MSQQRRTRRNRAMSSLSAQDQQKLQQRISQASESSGQLTVQLEPGERVPLTAAQQILWYAWKLAPQDASYNLAGALHFEGTLEVAKVQAAFEALQAKHSALRICFVEQDEQVWQRDGQYQTITVAQLSHTTNGQDPVRQFVEQPFDLCGEPLLRIAIAQEPGRASLIVTMHHIITDGTSMQQLLNEFVTLYAGEVKAVEPVPGFLEFAKWQAEQELDALHKAQLAVWQQQLADCDEALRLPANHQQRHNPPYEVAFETQQIPATLWQKISTVAGQYQITPYLLLLSAWQVLLARLSGSQTIRVGVPIANRHRSETQNVVGYFVNTQVMPLQLADTDTFAQLLEKNRVMSGIAQSNQDLPIDQLVSALKPARQMGVHPIFQVMFNYLRRDKRQFSQMAELKLLNTQMYRFGMPFDLQLDVIEDVSDGTSLNLVYASELYSQDFALQCLAQLKTLLEACLNEPQRPVYTQPVLEQQDVAQLLLNGTGPRGFEYTHPVTRLISEQSARTPQAVALRFAGQSLSYAALEQRTNQLAHYLNQRGIGAEDKVALVFERSLEMVISIVAVVKAGAAYVPLEPSLPEERIAYIAGSSGLALFLGDDSLHRFSALDEQVQRVHYPSVALSDYPSHLPAHDIAPTQLAYVIYTSGSTGKPKGVGNQHSAIYNRIAWQQSAYPIGPDDKVLQKTPFGFDVSVWEFFWPLMYGAELVIAEPGAHKDSSQLLDTIKQYGVTTLHFVPSMLQAFIGHEQVHTATSIRRILCSGEALPSEVQAQALNKLPKAKLYNLYGPTEAAVDVSHFTCHGDPALPVPIGAPIAGIRLYVLDQALNLCPQGVAGELYIAGDGLARGYMNRPDLSAERFVADPLMHDGSRMYRSGDLVCWNDEGQLDYLGRIDHQVKIRGFRIELGEIEAALYAIDGVREAVVVATGSGASQRLVGYVSANADASVDGPELKLALADSLPDYMVPAVIMVLATLPLNSNGKIDRKALPAPDAQQSVAYLAPQTPQQQQLAEIWQTVLGVAQVGRLDNFFALGGDSISALKVIALSKKRQLAVDIQSVLNAPTLEALADSLTDAISVVEIARQDKAYTGLSFAQERQWFLWKLDPNSSAYHISGSLHLSGELNTHALQYAFDHLLAQHEALRTLFVEDDAGTVRTQVLPEGRCDIRYQAPESDVARAEFKQQLVSTPFDLTQGPLLRVGVIADDAQQHELVVVMHHIISDGWSLKLIVADFVRAYEAACAGETLTLVPQALRYSDFAAWQRDWLAAGEEQKQLAYWQERLGDEHTPLALPADLNSEDDSQRNQTRSVRLSSAQRQTLSDFAAAQGVTLFNVLMTAWQVLLHKYSGQRTIRVGMPVANRHHSGTQDIVGFFINTLVIDAQISAELALGSVMTQINDALRGAQAHQDLPFEKLLDHLSLERHLGASPLFQVLFNHQRLEDGALRQFAGLSAQEGQAPTGVAQFDLVLNSLEREDGTLELALDYVVNKFSAARIDALLSGLQCILTAMRIDLQQPVGGLNVLPQAELDRLTPAPALYQAEHLPGADIATQIQQQAQRSPNKAALSVAGQTLSYAELESRANQFAQYLREQGVDHESRVAVVFSRHIDTVVAFLAVLKAGGCYVPVDAQLPSERIETIAAQCSLTVCVGDSLSPVLPAALVYQSSLCAHYSESALPQSRHPQQLAYVIYTSGSTGTPKGVAVSDLALSNHCAAVQSLYQYQAEDRCAISVSFGFDASIEQLWGPLLVGATVVLDEFKLLSEQELSDFITAQRITVAGFTPAYIQQFDTLPAQLRLCIVGGEAWSAQHCQALLQRLPQTTFVNAYGPSETVITPLAWTQAQGRELQGGYVPLGQPIGQRGMVILDDSLNVLPYGMTGELYLSGVEMARGYLAQPGQTAERFVANPFADDGSRLYRTGDLVRWNAQGQLEYMGRCDHQLKIRGYRVEAGEIEARLLAHGEVEKAIVVADESLGSTRLVAYVSGRAEHAPQADALSASLAEQLPDYMVPSVIMVLERMPLTHNGKIDRRALPQPQSSQRLDTLPPQGPQEVLLANIWQQLLNLASVGREDNFFALGGDSILSLQIIARLRQQGYALSAKQIFTHQSIAKLAPLMTRIAGDAQAQQQVSGEVALLPIQQAFFARTMTNRAHWNQAVMLALDAPIAQQTLQTQFASLLRHHDALRLRYQQDDTGQWQQRYSDFDPAMAQQCLWYRDASADEITLIAEQAQRSLDLQAGPLLRAVHLTLDDGSARLLLVIHHLAVDGVSWRVLLEDFTTLWQYPQAELGAKTHSVQFWAKQLQSYPAQHAGEFDWWQQQVQTHTTLPELNPAGSRLYKDVEQAEVVLDSALTQALLTESGQAYRTQVNDLLLSALSEALYRWTRQTVHTINLEGHGREPWSEQVDLSRTVGWFTSLFPVTLTRHETLGDTIRYNKEQLRAIPNKGIGYGAFRYYGSAEQQAVLNSQGLGEIEFNYLGQLDSAASQADNWRPASEDSGMMLDPEYVMDSELSILGQVLGGQLQLRIRYAPARLPAQAVAQFAAHLKQALTQVIGHCGDTSATLTPSDLPLSGLTQTQIDNLPLALENISNVYPLSPMQQGMLFQSLYQGGETYINQSCFMVTGLDVARFKAAWQQVIERHDALRTGFVDVDGVSLQYVTRSAELDWQTLDWRDRPVSEAALKAFARQESRRGFDLQGEPGLSRMCIIELSDGRHALVWTMHHILTDGWSRSAMLGEVLMAYEGQTLPPVAGQYGDYIGYLAQLDEAQNRAFWQQQLAPLEEPSYLSGTLSKPQSGQFGGFDIHLSEAEFAQLVAFCQDHRITQNTLVQGAWALLLSRYLGRDTVCFGATTSGRPNDLAGHEAIQGMFINTVPMVTSVDPAQSLSDWLQAQQSTALAVREHEFTPLYDIQKLAAQSLELSREGLFDTLLVFENYPIDEALLQQDARQTRFEILEDREETNFPLTISFIQEDTLRLHFSYQGSELAEADVKALAAQYKTLILNMLQAPQARLCAFSLVSETQQQTLQGLGFGESITPLHSGAVEPIYLPGGEVPQLGATQYQDVVSTINRLAELTPDAEAVICDGRSYSYKELADKSSQLAYYLREQGVKPEQRVGVALARGIDLPLAFLAILKAGAVYVPMDLSYPQERLAYMIKDSQMAHILTSDNSLDDIAGGATLHPFADIELSEQWQQPAVCPAQGAYLIYTSGSTGNPKGVLVSRASIAAHCRGIGRRYEMRPSDRELIFMSFCFDGAHERWLTVLTHGAAVVIRPERQWDLHETYQNLHQQRVSIAVFPPVFLRELAAHVEQVGNPPPVRVYCFGGDAMPQATFELAQRVLKPDFFINGYGPTETVVTPLTWKALPGSEFDAVYAPIGELVGQRQAWLLDSHLNLVLPGQVGELYLAEEIGLARGYLNRPDLTAERFVANPFGNDGSRLYRTGDLVRWNEQGLMEYLGRTDHQVKIRGFRIELGEIETLLRKRPEVRQAVVVADETPSGKRLVAYVSGHQGELPDEAALKAMLTASLPDYMVPAVIMALSDLPLNSNGKIDRKALPKAELQSEVSYVAPHNHTEALMAEIWQTVLGVAHVGRRDNFFALGGDSISGLKVISLWQQRSEQPLTLKQLWQASDLAALVATMQNADNSVLQPLNPHTDNAETLYCFHEGNGLTAPYRPLAEQLTGQFNCVGVAPAANLSEINGLTALAEHYTEALMAAQPHGTFHLMGWSLGGALAVLVARSLKAQGRNVRQVYLVDSWNPCSDFAATQLNWSDWAREWIGGAAQSVDAELHQTFVAELTAALQQDLKDADTLATWLVANRTRFAELFNEELLLLPEQELGKLLSDGFELYRLARMEPTGNQPDYTLDGVTERAHAWWSTDADPAATAAYQTMLGSTVTATHTEDDHQQIIRAAAVQTDLIAKLTQRD
ncbi:non-ribosomal peptide synthetase [Pseudoalteromonas rubra]|uniref:non-ribosomal peptide synthetase n=1 Tax=Pseudoalteromonas rubra TaxID=43658 RepID=UPI000F795437|nr:non-ribosomal peptide synthetase [Pseudoalteromonas rubra]